MVLKQRYFDCMGPLAVKNSVIFCVLCARGGLPSSDMGVYVFYAFFIYVINMLLFMLFML